MSLGSQRALIREHARERLAWEVERARLIDQILHLAGKPWTLPPAVLVPDRPPVDLFDDDLVEADQLP